MNHRQYIDILLEGNTTPEGKYAIVKNVPANNLKHYGDILPVTFNCDMKKFIGKRLWLYPSEFYKGLWNDPEYNFYYHPDWLTFEDEEQPNLFKRDPE